MKNSQNQPKIVSLRDVKREMETKNKENQAKKQNQSESDSGFENKSSSSETEMQKKKPEDNLPALEDTQVFQKTLKTNMTRHNSTTIPRNRPVR